MPSTLRVTFKKEEGIRYTGHLDVLRLFVRGMRRAEIPLKYSEGFNPHAVMAFALPLGVGVTSGCELMDVALLDRALPPEAFVSQVNRCMQPGSITVLHAAYTDEKMPEIVRAEYVIRLENGGGIDRAELQRALARAELLVDKKSKRQIRQINLMEHLFEKEIIYCEGNKLTLRVVVSAGNTFNVKPQLVVQGLQAVCPALRPVLVLPHRTRFIFK